ncbi:MAG: hypothetical protein M3R04_03370 [bacterium]|nr:hypothetical protein [bacterium]
MEVVWPVVALVVGLGIGVYVSRQILSTKNSAAQQRFVDLHAALAKLENVKGNATLVSAQNLDLTRDVETRDIEIGDLRSLRQTLSNQVDDLRQQRDNLDTAKQVVAAEKKLGDDLNKDQLDQLRYSLRNTENERDKARDKVTFFEVNQEQQRKEHEASLDRAERQRESWAAQEERVLVEERAAQYKREADRDRMWNEHQTTVTSRITELCKLPEYQLPLFTNENLPSEWMERFGTKFKPDVLIQLENQFVVIDAKHSKAGSLATYIGAQVKDFAKKAESSQLIYPTVFFVVPTFALAELKELLFREAGYRIYVVGIEAMAVLLAMFKRIEGYALADKLDPVERENIVNSLAHLHHHIRFRNAADILISEQGLGVLHLAEKRMSPEMQGEVDQAIGKIRLPNIQQPEAKKLVANLEHQQTRMLEMSSPKALVSGDDFDSARFIAGEATAGEA